MDATQGARQTYCHKDLWIESLFVKRTKTEKENQPRSFLLLLWQKNFPFSFSRSSLTYRLNTSGQVPLIAVLVLPWERREKPKNALIAELLLIAGQCQSWKTTVRRRHFTRHPTPIPATFGNYVDKKNSADVAILNWVSCSIYFQLRVCYRIMFLAWLVCRDALDLFLLNFISEHFTKCSLLIVLN